jgi:apurinic endonuclease APN1
VTRLIGAHLREYQTVEELIAQADALKISTFQFFLYKIWESIDEATIPSLKNQLSRFKKVFVHASYRVNLAHPFKYHPILEYELRILSRFGLNFYVIHPGSIGKDMQKEVAIKYVIKTLETVFKKHPQIHIILENTPQPDRLLGAKLLDLKNIFDLLGCPEAISFCIDTAHAFSAGYDIRSDQGFDEFFSLCDTLLTPQKIALLHLNDTIDECGSGRDQHALPGQGLLGLSVVKKVISSDLFKNVPIIVEPPPLSIEALSAMLIELNSIV